MGADAPERAREQLQSLLEKACGKKAEAICRYEEQLTNKRQPQVDAATMALFSSCDSLSLNRMDQRGDDVLRRGPSGLLLRTTQSTFLTILALVESKHKAFSGTYDSIVKVADLAASINHSAILRAVALYLGCEDDEKLRALIAAMEIPSTNFYYFLTQSRRGDLKKSPGGRLQLHDTRIQQSATPNGKQAFESVRSILRLARRERLSF